LESIPKLLKIFRAQMHRVLSHMCRVRKDPRMSWRKEQRPEKEVSILQIKGVSPEYEGKDSNDNQKW
jgi:hypothetical protein